MGPSRDDPSGTIARFELQVVRGEDIEAYEGLIFETARRIAAHVEADFDDIRQELRIKVWRALGSFDANRSSVTRDNFVFSCVMNAKKDLLKKKRRGEAYIEDFATDQHAGATPDSSEAARASDYRRSRFEARYLALSEEMAYAEVDNERLMLPATLTGRERTVLLLLYRDWRQPNASEVARELGLTRSQIETTVASLRLKLADWRPAGDEAEVVALPERSSRFPVAA